MSKDAIKKIGKWLAGVCAILFVVSGVTALLLVNMERKVFSSETYKLAFEKQNLYESMPHLLAVTVSSYIGGSESANTLLKGLSTSDWEASIKFILPPAEIKTITNGALDSTFDYLNGKSDSAVISLTPIKSHLTGASGVEAVTQLLQAQPDCTTEQLTQIALSALTGGDIALLCNPPAEVMGLVTPLIESQLQLMTLAFPDEVTILSGEKSNTPSDPRIKLNRVRLVMKLTFILPILFLLAVTVFAVRSLNEWFSWWGWSFMTTGIISIGIALLGSPVVGFVIGRVMQNQASDFMPSILISAMQEAAREVAQQVLRPVAIEGLLFLLLGVGMVGIAIFVRRKGYV